jgi:multidrug efflux system membrane fusion protein
MGQLLKIHFKEGQDVKKGELIFTIDPAPYKEKLNNAEARLSQDLVQLQFNKSETERYGALLEMGGVSKSEYENKQTLAASYEAIIKGDRANVENARLQLDYCYIRAALDGRTGTYGVHEGTMVRENETRLAVINQITPVYVKFSVPEKYLFEIRKYIVKEQLKVKANIPGTKENAQKGVLTFIDNAVDSSTGMILLKATFPNKDKALWPGQFVNVSLQLAVEPEAIVVPAKAVEIGQKGAYIFVVKPDKKVEYRIVTVDRTIGDETVVSKGVKPGETVVTDGQLKLKDGFPVEIRESLLPANKNVQEKLSAQANTKKQSL